MTDKFRKFIPVGFSPAPAVCLYLIGYLVSICYSVMIYIDSVYNALNNISDYEGGQYIFLEGHYMRFFSQVRGSCFSIFILYFVILLAFSIYCFISHFIGSKSIYTMRRLKNRHELFIRCALISLIMILISLITIAILNAMFIEIYLDIVPEDNLWPWWNTDNWRDLL